MSSAVILVRYLSCYAIKSYDIFVTDGKYCLGV